MRMQTQRSIEYLVVPLRLDHPWMLYSILSALLGLACLISSIVGPVLALPKTAMCLLLFFFSLFFTPLILYVFYRCRARLILTERGLRWRTWGDWRQTTWDGVRDYYDHAFKSDGTSDKLMTLETDVGNLTLNRRWPESSSVREMVQERARQVKEADWDIQGGRIGGMQVRTFIYDQKDFWPLVAFNVILLSLTILGWHSMLLPAIAANSWKSLSELWSPGEFWYSLVEIVSCILFFLFVFYIVHLPLLIVIAVIPGMTDNRRRHAERITTSRDGITYEDGKGRTITAAWSEVTGYFLQPSVLLRSRLLRAMVVFPFSRYRQIWRWIFTVETRHGSFQYSPFISDAGKLGKIFEENGIEVQGRDLDQIK